MPDYSTVLAQASLLDVQDRLRLIDELACSVPDDQPPSLSQEWLDEIARRSDEFDSGKIQPVEWSEARKRLSAIVES